MKKSKNLIIIGVIIALAVAAGAYFTMGEGYQGMMKKPETTNSIRPFKSLNGMEINKKNMEVTKDETKGECGGTVYKKKNGDIDYGKHAEEGMPVGQTNCPGKKTKETTTTETPAKTEDKKNKKDA